MKKYFYIVLIATVLLCSKLSGQNKSDFLILSYNVENLFDTIDNPSKNDQEFLPDSKKKWNSKAYYSKLTNIAKVIASVDSAEMPAVISLCEVENYQVLLDLTATPTLTKTPYTLVHFESIDPRGIDDALLYRPDKFKVLVQKNFLMNLPLNGKYFKHDFLYVKGLAGTDTLHFFVNHWKSRAPQSDSLLNEEKRILEATYLKSKTDSILKVNTKSKIIILGDFNDTPTDKSISSALNAYGTEPVKNNMLFNPFYSISQKGEGSYLYKDTWYMFDQIIVSGALLNGKGYIFDKKRYGVFKPEWLLYKNPKGKIMPSKYYSDHLPVYIWLKD